MSASHADDDVSREARLERIPRALPPLLSFVAGYVDSCTFLALFGLFVAQVTGSFVTAGAQLVAKHHGPLVNVMAIPIFILAGICAAVLMALAGRNRTGLACVLVLETALLGGFLMAGLAAAPFRDLDAPAAIVASFCGIAAMGIQSAAVRLLPGGIGSTNVMTTNTSQFAIDAAEIGLSFLQRLRRRHAAAEQRYTRAKRQFAAVLAIILGFLGGAAAGALAFDAVGLICLAAPMTVLIGLSIWAALTRQRETE